MKKISSYLANFDAPTSGFSEGKLKDNPGDDSGSGATVLTVNDLLYPFYALIKSYRTGGVSDIDESENASDVRDALEEMMGMKVDGVSAWSSATTYSTLGVSVMRYGMQFVVINATGNTNKDPVTQPGYWMKAPSAGELFDHFSTGHVLRAKCTPTHDYNNATLYQQYFKLGVHKVGGASGVMFNAWGVHLDGSTVTGGSALDTLLASYFLQTTFAPGTPKVLKNAKGTVDRAMDASGGDAPTIGARQEDQGQSHIHTYPGSAGVGGAISEPTIQVNQQQNYTQPTTTPVNDGVGGGVPRMGSETRVKSFVTGVPYFVIMVAA